MQERRRTQLRDSLRRKVSRQQFATWFDRTDVVRWKDGLLVLGVPNRFYKEWLQESVAHDSELPKGWLVPMGGNPWDDSIIQQSKEMGLTQICPRADITTPELVDKIHSEGFMVRCLGLFNEELMRHAVDVGADGATVNFPDKMTEYLKAKGIEQA